MIMVNVFIKLFVNPKVTHFLRKSFDLSRNVHSLKTYLMFAPPIKPANKNGVFIPTN